ncbi:MAG: vWA domain-containing protein, partial [Anaerovoracaceae bacterium]
MKRLKRYVAGLVTAVMILSLGTAFAAPSSSESVTVDSSTLTDFNNVFGKGSLSTEDIGRIWTDKTVSDKSISLSGDIGQDVTIEKEAGAEFQVALSALGSAADITDTTKVPTDTVFVLDLSNSMWTGGYTKIDQMIEGANDAIKTLMRANPQNRVAVVGYST